MAPVLCLYKFCREEGVNDVPVRWDIFWRGVFGVNRRHVRLLGGLYREVVLSSFSLTRTCVHITKYLWMKIVQPGMGNKYVYICVTYTAALLLPSSTITLLYTTKYVFVVCMCICNQGDQINQSNSQTSADTGKRT